MLKKRNLMMLVVVCLSFIPSLMDASETRGINIKLRAEESANAPIAKEVNLYRYSYALVIGIDNYTQGWPRLSNAIRDARLLAEELQRKGFEVTLKTDLNSSELEGALKEFFIIKGEAPEARLFVWFAGHGHTIDGEGFLIPADAPMAENGALFRFKALSMRRLGEYVRLAQSKHAFVVFDSCFSGTIFTSQRSRPPAAVTRATILPVRQFLSSGDAQQQVSDDGMFRKLFIRAIRGEERADANGDGYLTGSELGMFLTDRLTNLTRSSQTPRYGKLRDADYDRGDFVFVLHTADLKDSEKPDASQPSVNVDREAIFWESIQDSNNPASFETYLSQFPNGTFAPLAKLKLDELKSVHQKAISEEKRILFKDNFNNNNNDWYIGNDSDRELRITDGGYYFSHKRKKESWLVWKSVGMSIYDDFLLECDLKKIDGVNNYGYGVVWGLKDAGNHFTFQISGDGHYIYGKCVDGKFISIFDWRKSGYINKNASSNKLSVKKKGDRIEFYINDHLVDDIKTEELSGTKAGFRIDNKQSIRIEKLTVSKLR